MSGSRGDTPPMLQTAVEQSGADWVVTANVDGTTQVLSTHPDEASAREAERAVRASSERSAEAADDTAG